MRRAISTPVKPLELRTCAYRCEERLAQLVARKLSTMSGRPTKTTYRQSKKGMNIAYLAKFYRAVGPQSPAFVDEPLPVRAHLFTLRERIPRGGSFHPHRGRCPREHAGRTTATHHVGRFQPFRPPFRGYPLGCLGGFARIPGRCPLSGSAEQRPLRPATADPL